MIILIIARTTLPMFELVLPEGRQCKCHWFCVDCGEVSVFWRSGIWDQLRDEVKRDVTMKQIMPLDARGRQRRISYSPCLSPSG
jgi:hypothetical protein